MIRCTKIGIEPSPMCHEICVLASRCDALKAWEREKSKQEGKRRIAALIFAGGPDGINLVVPYQKTGVLIEGVNYGDIFPQWNEDPAKGAIWADPFRRETPDELEAYGPVSHIWYAGPNVKTRIEKLIEEIEEDEHEGAL